MSKIKVNQIEAATGSTITIPSGQTLDISSTTLTLPSTVVTTTGTQTLTNKTIGVSQLTGTLPVANGGTGLTSLGTASQVLRVNSGATGLEYGSLSSDVVKLATVSTTSTHTTIDVHGYFDDTIYSCYKLIMHSIKPENNAGEITAKFMTSSSATKDSDNYLVLHTGFSSSSGASGGQQDRRNWNVNSTNDWEGTWTPKNTSTSNTDYCSMVAYIINPRSTSQGKLVSYQFNTFSTNNGVHVVTNGHYFNNSTTECTGFRLYRSSNAFLQSAWSLYGFKK